MGHVNKSRIIAKKTNKEDNQTSGSAPMNEETKKKKHKDKLFEIPVCGRGDEQGRQRSPGWTWRILSICQQPELWAPFPNPRSAKVIELVFEKATLDQSHGG